MSDWSPTKHYIKTCNERSNGLWNYMDELSKHIDKIPEGQSKQYLNQYKSTLGLIAELYFFNAVSLEKNQINEERLNALHSKVFGDASITLPYKAEKEDVLSNIAKRYQENEPIIKWIDRDLKEKSKDLEKNNEGD